MCGNGWRRGTCPRRRSEGHGSSNVRRLSRSDRARPRLVPHRVPSRKRPTEPTTPPPRFALGARTPVVRSHRPAVRCYQDDPDRENVQLKCRIARLTQVLRSRPLPVVSPSEPSHDRGPEAAPPTLASDRPPPHALPSGAAVASPSAGDAAAGASPGQGWSAAASRRDAQRGGAPLTGRGGRYARRRGQARDTIAVAQPSGGATAPQAG